MNTTTNAKEALSRLLVMLGTIQKEMEWHGDFEPVTYQEITEMYKLASIVDSAI